MKKKELFTLSKKKTEDEEILTEAQPGSAVISFFGTKGGTGKTTAAVNTAAALSAAGMKTALLDFDLRFGDAGVFLDISKKGGIADLADEHEISAEAVKNLMFKHKSGVSVLCAPDSPELAEKIHPSMLKDIIESVRDEFDITVIDLPSALDEISITAAECSDAVYYVTDPEIPTLRNARICLDVMRKIGIGDNVMLVINKEGSQYVSKKDIEDTLGMKSVFNIPYDMKTASAAVNSGVTVSEAAPKSKMSKAFSDFAGRFRRVEYGGSDSERSL